MDESRRTASSYDPASSRSAPARSHRGTGLHLVVALVLLASTLAIAFVVSPALAGGHRGPSVDRRHGHEAPGVIRHARRFARRHAPHVYRRGARGGSLVRPGRLVPRLSRANVRTYAEPDNTLAAHVFAGTVNYRGPHGGWHAIDDRLRRVAGGYRNAANSYAVTLPSDLAAPVAYARGGASLRLGLEGARGTSAVAGATATYADALPHATVTYTAENTAVKEAITLRDRSAPERFVYDIAASRGLQARKNRAGGVDLLEPSGAVAFSVDAPVAYASKDPSQLHPVALRVSGRKLLLDARSAWLRRALRGGSVVIDPTVDFSPAPDCHLESDSPDTSFCSSTQIEVGWDGVGDNRGLAKFDLSSIPKDAIVLNAQLALHMFTESSTATKSVGVYRATKSFTSAATWNRYDGTNAWTAAGGDFSTTDSVVNPSVGGTLGWYYWYPTRIVQDMVSGPDPNQGFVIKDVNDRSVTNKVEFDSSHSTDTSDLPYLEVLYQPRVGNVSSYKYETQQLNDRNDMSVNVANGNLVLHGHDLDVPGSNGFDFALDRFWNSVWTNTYTIGAFANGSTAPMTPDVHLRTFGNGDAVFYRGDGAEFPYIANSGGTTFQTPPGNDADLVKNGDGTFTLTYRQSNEKLAFDSGGGLTSMTNRSGNKITLTRNASGGLTSVSDTHGRTFTVTPNASNQITDVTDAAGRDWHYNYTGNKLTSYVDPNGKTTSYHWNSASYIDQITTPGGEVTNVTYDGSNRVSSIVRTTDAGHTTGPATKFYYYAWGSLPAGTPCASTEAETIVTDPDYTGAVPPTPKTAHTTTYCTNVQDQAKSVWDGLGHQRSYSYDSNANLHTFQAPGGGNATLDYDSTTNNLLDFQYGGSTGPKTTLSYGSAQPYLPSSSQDPQQRTLNLAYFPGGGSTAPPNGALQNKTDQLATQNQASFQYRNADGTANSGTPSSITDPDGHATTLGFTTGDLTSITHPTGSGLGNESIAYDAVSRPCVITDGKGQKAAYSYDSLDRVLSIAYYPSSATVSGCTVTGTATTTVSHTYDADGNLKSISDPSGTANYSYDPLNRLTAESLPAGSNSYGYDAASNLTSLQDQGGTVSYGYDGANELSSETDPGASSSTTFTHNSDGQRTQTHYPSGVTVNYGYEAPGQRLTSVTNKSPSGTVLKSYTYSYQTSTTQPDCPASAVKDTNLRQSVTDNAGNTTTYCYDALDRLTEAKTSGPNASSYVYTYDGAGNRTAVSGSQTQSLSFDSGNKPTGTGWSFDAAGNGTASADGTTFGYNNLNQTSAITPSGGGTINRTYRGTGQDDLTLAGTVALQNNVLGLGIRDGNTYYTRDNSGALVDERQVSGSTTTTYNYLFDGQGSIVGLTDSSGTLQNSYSYDPYGNSTGNTGSVANVFRFQGGYLGTAGTYHFGQRYYQPQYGRWAQEDPIDQTGDLKQGDRYAFAGDDPVNLTDPSGESVGAIAGACVKEGATSAAVASVTGEGALAEGAAGCATGALGEGLKEAGFETAGKIVETIGNARDIYSLGKSALNDAGDAVSGLADSIF